MVKQELWEKYSIPELIEALLNFNYNDGEALIYWLTHNGATDRAADRCVHTLRFTLTNNKEKNHATNDNPESSSGED